jgi:hypothetical protein
MDLSTSVRSVTKGVRRQPPTMDESFIRKLAIKEVRRQPPIMDESFIRKLAIKEVKPF